MKRYHHLLSRDKEVAQLSLCRPDNVHWCVECCSLLRCCLLGDTGDGKIGCLGYGGGKTVDGLTQRPICRNFDCLVSLTPEQKEMVRQTIIALPAGQFQMSEVLKSTLKPLAW